MKQPQKRVRMFAGPNGSGKSRVKLEIAQELIKTYVNPDDMERGIREAGYLDITAFDVDALENEILPFFRESLFLKSAGLGSAAEGLRFAGGKLFFPEDAMNAYFASVASDFIRHKLLETGQSFSFETVMSSEDKVQFLKKAQNMGYRTYLYYVATEDPAVNIDRVRFRSQQGGHSVPEDKIVSRYYRSLSLLAKAIRNTNRAYLWDNTHNLRFLGEVTDAAELILQTDSIPGWLQKALQETFTSAGVL